MTHPALKSIQTVLDAIGALPINSGLSTAHLDLKNALTELESFLNRPVEVPAPAPAKRAKSLAAQKMRNYRAKKKAVPDLIVPAPAATQPE